MKRTVSIGVNSVPKYLYYIPLIRWAWKQFGWDTFIVYIGANSKFTNLIEKTCDSMVFPVCLFSQYPYPTETIAQVIRFYAFWHTNDFIMLSDSDMIPIGDYWNPHPDNITCYGRDLSDEHYPCCYVAMSSENWGNVMGKAINQIKFDLREFYPKAKNKWTTDQNLLTNRLNKIDNKVEVNRGIDPKTHYPIGRVDRSAWSLNHSKYIDCHAPHDILTNEKSFHNVTELLRVVWPKEDFSWYYQYHKEFKKLL